MNMLYKNLCRGLIALVFLASAALSYASEPLSGWLLLGPMPIPAEEAETPALPVQKAFFESDQVDPKQTSGIHSGQAQPFGQARLTWMPYPESKDGSVDLQAFYEGMDYAVAYAYLEWNEESSREVVWGLGSDDAMRIWLNGVLVYDFFDSRSLTKDEDVLKVSLKEGSNRVLVKVLNQQWGWGFHISELSAADFGEMLYRRSGAGDLEAVSTLLELGADPNQVSQSGLTSWQFSRIRGYADIGALLEKAGANTRIPFPPKARIAERWLNRQFAEDEPGASVLIAQKGEIIFQKSYGMAEMESGRPLTPNSLFRIGSVSKQFTATAILLLVQDDLLSLDSKLSEFYPDIANADRISIRQMLNHTAGIRSYTENLSFTDSVTFYVAPERLERIIAGYKADFEPGEDCVYSNSGYFLLGRIAEKVSGKGLADLWQERIFEPLEMSRSSVYDNRLRIARPDEAYGYSWEDTHYVRALNWDMSWAGGAGNIASTTEDLYRWNEGLFGGKVLSEGMMREAHSPGILNNGSTARMMGTGYGFGWMLHEFRGLKVISHTGGLHGFQSNLLRIPEHDITVVVLLNTLPHKEGSAVGVSEVISEIFFYELMSAHNRSEQVEIDPALLPDYAGRYAYPGGAVMTVRVEGDQLFAQIVGQPEFELFAEAPDVFFWKVVSAKIEFVRNDQGKVTGGKHSQGGRTMDVPKMEDEPTLELSEDALDQFVGTYEFQGNELKVERRGRRLFALIQGQPELEMFARSEKEFYFKVFQADIRFETDAQGKATKLFFVQGAMELEAERIE